MGWSLAAAAFALAATSASACDHEAKAAEANGVKDTKAVAVATEAKGCDMPCCAHAKAVEAKAEVAAKVETPCAGHEAKGCSKKAAPAVAAKAEPAKEAAQPQPAAGAGSQR